MVDIEANCPRKGGVGYYAMDHVGQTNVAVIKFAYLLVHTRLKEFRWLSAAQLGNPQ